MALFGTLPEGRERKRPVRRSGRGRNAGASRRTPAAQQESPVEDAVPPSGDEPAGADEAAAGSQSSPDAFAPEDRKVAPTPADPAHGAGTDHHGSGHLATDPDGVAFTAEDRQHLRRTAEDTAWIRSRLTVRSLDAEAHARAKARRDGHDRRWQRFGLKAAGYVAVAMIGQVLGVAVEHRYGVTELVAAYGAELAEDARILPGGDGG